MTTGPYHLQMTRTKLTGSELMMTCQLKVLLMRDQKTSSGLVNRTVGYLSCIQFQENRKFPSVQAAKVKNVNISSTIRKLCVKKIRRMRNSLHFIGKEEEKEGRAPRDDYNEVLELGEHYKRYGYNITPFEYPIKRDPAFQAKFVNRMKGQFEIPGCLKA